MTDLPTLLQRLRSATGADRSIDGLIWAFADPAEYERQCCFKGFVYAGHRHTKAEKAAHIARAASYFSPRYTESLDLSLALFQAKLPGNGEISVTRYSRSEGFVWEGEVETTNPKHRWITAEAPTAALALLCALVQALIGEEEHG